VTVLVAVYVFVRRSTASRWHLVVPLAVTVAVPLGVAAGGPFRDGRAVAVCWATAALVTHLAIAYGSGRRRAGPRLAAAVVVVVVVASAVVIGRLGQATWRAADLRAVGVPLMVVDVPGFAATRAGAGRHSVQVVIADRPYPRELGGRQLTVTTSRANQPCGGPGPTIIDETAAGLGPRTVRYCLAARGYVVIVQAHPSYPGEGGAAEHWSIEPLLRSMTLREATAEELAHLPEASNWEAD